MNEDEIRNLIENDEDMMEVIYLVDKLDLPDYLIGAGFVRNFIWDKLHHYNKLTPLNDIDVVYFEPLHIDKSLEKQYEDYLNSQKAYNWSVKNQARMHLKNYHEPYLSTLDAIAHWTETATAIGVRLNEKNKVEIIAPYGIEDLVNLIVRPIPNTDLSIFSERVNNKEWLTKWPLLKVIYE